ncbi:malonate decarboxylase holo-ACP synthase [Pseudomonas marincola]|uniref:malonate decarboxylase holo-ACP synthase n=1 Tax=Pseudomonas marincola TaxID=437900 RepID=UPI0008E8A3FB|nr:malonate decarboxylase holo-ACP synthase [Pseudomonas marincola]MAB96544.1 malonate decarboxylase holo-ACP synthase [Pseudomonadaceae bacterium]SFU16136.1 phosphoribosyl-dephospho-CoA transferase [Pseudomonas marincola]|tara:strand:+ start:353 stop:1012 length:660 start_codon:yes stop_codon:yes gene_type:complete
MTRSLSQPKPQGYLPHDLLWGFTSAYLPADAPAWVVSALAERPPVVVRRAVGRPGWIAVGVRGKQRDQRFAGWMPVLAVSHCVRPEQLVHSQGWQSLAEADYPVIQALKRVAPVLHQSDWRWGVTGSLGFQLASGIKVIHPASDLDLLLRAPTPLSRLQAQHLLAQMSDVPAAVDVQVQCPHGAVALREWACSTARVLLKSQSGPLLVSDPWAQEAVVA